MVAFNNPSTPKRVASDLIFRIIPILQTAQTIDGATLQLFFQQFAPSGTAVVLPYCVLIKL
jgi:hypothetical protein